MTQMCVYNCYASINHVMKITIYLTHFYSYINNDVTVMKYYNALLLMSRQYAIYVVIRDVYVSHVMVMTGQ